MNSSSQPKRFFYETIADRFETLDNPYDISRRLDLVFDELLVNYDLRDRLVLDAGCGYGAFSKVIATKGARLVSCDIAEKLVQLATSTISSWGSVDDASRLGFVDNTFDAVVSSEMIEHTESPQQTIHELTRVLKPGGLLALTTPNKAWQWLVRLSSKIGTRPFQGIENFLSWQELEKACANSDLQLLYHSGFHPWPFQIKLWKMSEKVDTRFGRSRWATIMINQAILAYKL
jgi:2-polyprenyl-3-methyl-5-hydroxy-6-metoxy-1,4-benzoquinol methylase